MARKAKLIPARIRLPDPPFPWVDGFKIITPAGRVTQPMRTRAARALCKARGWIVEERVFDVGLKWKGISASYLASATYHGNGKVAAYIECEDTVLKVRIAHHHPQEEWKDKGGYTWSILYARFKSLKEAKQAATAYINEHEEVWPKVD